MARPRVEVMAVVFTLTVGARWICGRSKLLGGLEEEGKETRTRLSARSRAFEWCAADALVRIVRCRGLLDTALKPVGSSIIHVSFSRARAQLVQQPWTESDLYQAYPPNLPPPRRSPLALRLRIHPFALTVQPSQPSATSTTAAQ